MKLRFFGDLFCYDNLFLEKKIVSADVNFLNLEVPITKASPATAIRKSGPSLHGSRKTFETLLESFEGKLFFNIANNHIGDFGEVGIKDTISVISNVKNAYFGGVSKGCKIVPTIIGDTSIAVLAVCEKQFGISQPDILGADYISPKIYAKIVELKKSGYFVVVSVHCAEEMNQWCAPEIRNLFKSYIDIGADVVYNTHTHVPSGFEKYKDGIILYGMGNFVVNADRRFRAKYAVDSVVYEIDTDSMNVSHFWTQVDESGRIVRRNPIKNYIEDCIEPLSSNDNRQLIALWQEFSVRIYKDSYKTYVSPNLKRRVKDFIKTVLKRDCFFFSKHAMLTSYLMFACLSHRLAIETALGVLSGAIIDLRTPRSKTLIDKYYQK